MYFWASFLLKKCSYFLKRCVWVHVCLCSMCDPGAYGSQKKVLDSPETGVVKKPLEVTMGVLGV